MKMTIQNQSFIILTLMELILMNVQGGQPIQMQINQEKISKLFITQPEKVIKQSPGIKDRIEQQIRQINIIRYKEQQIDIDTLKLDDVMLLIALVSTQNIFQNWKSENDNWIYSNKIQDDKQQEQILYDLLKYLVSNKKYLGKNRLFQDQELFTDLFISIILNKKIDNLKRIYNRQGREKVIDIPELNKIDRNKLYKAFESLVDKNNFEQQSVNIVSAYSKNYENKQKFYKMIPPYNAYSVEELNQQLQTYFMKNTTFNIFVQYDTYEQFFTYYFYENNEQLPLNENDRYKIEYSSDYRLTNDNNNQQHQQSSEQQQISQTITIYIYKQKFQFVGGKYKGQQKRIDESILQQFREHTTKYDVGENESQNDEETGNKSKNKNSNPIKNQHIQKEPWFQKRRQAANAQQQKNNDDYDNDNDNDNNQN